MDKMDHKLQYILQKDYIQSQFIQKFVDFLPKILSSILIIFVFYIVYRLTIKITQK